MRPRRRRRQAIPTGLAEISLCELTRWSVAGPMIEGDGTQLQPTAQDLYRIWPDWTTFLRFYGEVRAEWRRNRPWLRDQSVVERVYVAALAGADPEHVRQELVSAKDDPRHLLFNG